jgi:hypothetical protein
MRFVTHKAALALLVIVWSVPLPAPAQSTAPPAPVTLTPAQMEEFLLRAKIVRSRPVGTGVTGSLRATLSDGTLTHDAQIQYINQTRPLFQVAGAPPELNFKDAYRYNIAGYRLAMLLGLDNVPMSVERRVDGKLGAVTWWIDDVMMDEKERLSKDARGPDPERTAMQTHIMRVFDELISNRDRNMGNLLWTADWKMWMIDHTRSFRRNTDLLKPVLLERIERSLLDKLRTLTRESVTKAVGNSLTRIEIESMLERRDDLVKLFEGKIAERGEGAILYILPR